MVTSAWLSSAAQKIKKLSETPVTVHNIAKLCVIDGKNREITKKLVQPVPPHPCWFQWETLVAGAWSERKKMFHGGSFLKLADDDV